jgi:hypothetical protein
MIEESGIREFEGKSIKNKKYKVYPEQSPA